MGITNYNVNTASRLFDRCKDLLHGLDKDIVVPDGVLYTVDSIKSFVSAHDPSMIIYANISFANGAYIAESLRDINCEIVLWTLREPEAQGEILELNALTGGYSAGKVISRYGIGYDNVDVDACTEKGIFVTNVPGYCSDDVSELAIGLMFDCLRQITNRDRLIRQGNWNIQSPYSFRLAGKTIGFIGGGSIARAFMKKMKGFDMELLVYSPSISQETFDPLGAKKVSLEELLQKSDVVSLHVPAIAKNIGIINKNTLSLMKKSAILINTGRGPLVNDEDLIEALNNGTIAFAGLDTHNHEPLGEKSPFCGLDNVVLTDHCAYNTREAVEALKVGAAENVAKCLVSGRPNTPVNMR